MKVSKYKLIHLFKEQCIKKGGVSHLVSVKYDMYMMEINLTPKAKIRIDKYVIVYLPKMDVEATVFKLTKKEFKDLVQYYESNKK